MKDYHSPRKTTSMQDPLKGYIGTAPQNKICHSESRKRLKKQQCSDQFLVKIIEKYLHYMHYITLAHTRLLRAVSRRRKMALRECMQPIICHTMVSIKQKTTVSTNDAKMIFWTTKPIQNVKTT